MGIIDDIKGRVAGVLDPEGQHSSVVGAIGELLEQHGGIEGTVQKLHENGLGDVARSWVGNGENLPINGEQIDSTFGAGTISSIAKRVGVSETVLKLGLVTLLPMLIDRLTPNGKVPSGQVDKKSLLETGLSLFGKQKAA